MDCGYNTNDDDYLSLVKREFVDRLKDFKPDIILHLLGHDTAKGDYGDRGLSLSFFPKLIEMIKEASKTCNERYLINTHGGADVSICEFVYKNAIRILAKE